MKAIIGAAVLALWAGAALAGDPAEGIWKTLPDDNGNFGHVEIKPCGPAFCGTLKFAPLLADTATWTVNGPLPSGSDTL